MKKKIGNEGIIYLDKTDSYFHLWNNHPVGKANLIPGINVFGTAIASDLGIEAPIDLNHESTFQSFKEILNRTKTENITEDFHIPHFNSKMIHYITSNREKSERVLARIENIKNLETLLPFPLIRWSAIYTLPCPLFPDGHRTERGLIWAHYRIWKDFVHFDLDLIADFESGNNPNVSRMSTDKVYLIDSQGNYFKYGLPFNMMDRIVIFEDDVVHTIKELNSTLLEELTDMNNVDVLYLGWCDGRAARPVPLCLHAYALTRQGAKKLIHYYEPCGRAVDEQFVMIIKNGWLKYRRAHPYSYSGKIVRDDFPCHGDKTFGLFRQCKYLYGSLNGH
jgi:hypothetical protein